MTYYLISFPSDAMVVSDEEFAQAVHDSHAVVEAAKVAGVWVFGGGIDADEPAFLIDAEGRALDADAGGRAPRRLDGGFTVLDLPDREAAFEWAGRIAAACRCPQEVRAFGADPEQ